jgi:hypothetical protein
MATFNAGDLGLTVARKTATPTSLESLVQALRDAVAGWETLASDERRENGGRITALARSAAKFASALVEDHGANPDAVRDLIATRGIIGKSNADIIATLFPADDNADDDAKTTAKTTTKTTTAKAA